MIPVDPTRIVIDVTYEGQQQVDASRPLRYGIAAWADPPAFVGTGLHTTNQFVDTSETNPIANDETKYDHEKNRRTENTAVYLGY